MLLSPALFCRILFRNASLLELVEDVGWTRPHAHANTPTHAHARAHTRGASNISHMLHTRPVVGWQLREHTSRPTADASEVTHSTRLTARTPTHTRARPHTHACTRKYTHTCTRTRAHTRRKQYIAHAPHAPCCRLAATGAYEPTNS